MMLKGKIMKRKMVKRKVLKRMTPKQPAAARKAGGISRAKGRRRSDKAAKRLATKKVPSGDILGYAMSDRSVAVALARILGMEFEEVEDLMRDLAQPILKVAMLGSGATQRPSKLMLESAKVAVLRFFEDEEALGDASNVIQAFYIASREPRLTFNWTQARTRVRRARLDRRRAIDTWQFCLAMLAGATNSDCDIWVAGTRKIDVDSLASLICHEALHNMARRVRIGNPYLAEETEHIAMAFLGDPQLMPATSAD